MSVRPGKVLFATDLEATHGLRPVPLEVGLYFSSRLQIIHPALAAEMREGLVNDDAPELVPQVDDLRIIRGCGCGDSFCGNFYTSLQRGPLRTLVLTPFSLLADACQGRLVYVEVLFRPDIKDVLVETFGEEFYGPKTGGSLTRERSCWVYPPERRGRTRR